MKILNTILLAVLLAITLPSVSADGNSTPNAVCKGVSTLAVSVEKLRALGVSKSLAKKTLFKGISNPIHLSVVNAVIDDTYDQKFGYTESSIKNNAYNECYIALKFKLTP